MYSEALLTGQNLSLSEALAMGGQTTVIGLAIVFAVLIILMIVLSLRLYSIKSLKHRQLLLQHRLKPHL